MSVISVRNLTKIYSKPHLFRTITTTGVLDLNFEVKEGEIFGLLGLNGSGKTTTIKLMLGLLKPTTGIVEVLGKSLSDRSVLKNIGFLPEVPYFYRYLTAFEILSLYANLSRIGGAEQKVKDMLEKVGLYEWKDKRLIEFSKGMLQRIGIAQTLLHDPSILIYDEPVSGLDPLAIQEMRNLLVKLKSLGKTIFLSSHLISEVEKVCDRVGIIVKGRLVSVLEQKDWQKDGGLEEIFVSNVSGSNEMGRITI